MKKGKSTYYVFAFLFFITPMSGQISPGDLSLAHTHLEGLSNCTECHTLGEKVADAKCLNCHDEIATLLHENRGYHASDEVKKKDCISCHSDHHGRKFEMIRFDEDNFEHDLTGYTLQGQHKKVDCRDCHTPENVYDSNVQSREGTFLGLSTTCVSCHDDFHQNTLNTDCASCHDLNAFRPAPGFDHGDAKFNLKGAHKEINCLECHEKTVKNNLEFQVFSGLAFDDCKVCHGNPHASSFGVRCSTCHTETSFSTFTGANIFNHGSTDFELKGSHQKINCFDCHDINVAANNIFQDNIGITESQCMACHADKHEGNFGQNCIDCHNEEDFLNIKSIELFNHDLTDYPLTGKHEIVDCKKCHNEKYTEAIDFSSCNACHDDYHQGEFINNQVSPDCVECHSLEHGFSYTLYTLDRHQTSNFPLDGAHLATPCFACHVGEDHWSFRNIGTTCVDCHDDLHAGFINEKFYPENRCESCHTIESWRKTTFDHDNTSWPLVGQHTAVNCRACHFELDLNNRILKQTFHPLETNCIACHKNIHGGQFEIDGVTICARCHDTNSWMPNQFDHNITAFPLEGKHTEITCAACHNYSKGDDQHVVNYKIERFECIDCHL